ncbi:MAG: IS3 family transposase [Victivallaceae bacterium]|nr:IS3 family transposase [Victivallaceae bacterium]
MKRDVDEYIAFFNEKRLHGKLGYKTPNQIEEMFQNGELDVFCPESKNEEGVRTNGQDVSLSQMDL